jgi:hypothetical protein
MKMRLQYLTDYLRFWINIRERTDILIYFITICVAIFTITLIFLNLIFELRLPSDMPQYEAKQIDVTIVYICRSAIVVFIAIFSLWCVYYRRLNLNLYKSDLDPISFIRLKFFRKRWRIINNLANSIGHLNDQLVLSLTGCLDTLTSLMPIDEKHQIKQFGEVYFINCNSKQIVGDLPLQQIFPLILCHSSGINDPKSILKLIGYDKLLTIPVGILLVVGNSSIFDWTGFINRFRKVYARELILITNQNLEDIIKEKNPHKYLRRHILQQINITTVSPFITTGPISEDMFFGRENELRDVMAGIKSSSYIIIGGRRIGKTSMLYQLHRYRLPNNGFRTIFYDCSITPNYEAFLSAKIRDFLPALSSSETMILGDLLQSPPEDKPLVLILDEADKLIQADRSEDWRLFNMLRAISNSGWGQIILCGERTMQEALRDPTSPLFNFGNEIVLGPLSYRAVEELVTRPMNQLEIELFSQKEIVDRIFKFTSGHPNVVQRLCHRIIEHINAKGVRQITVNDIDTLIKNPGFQRNDFLSTFWEAATPVEKIISLLIAENKEIYTLHDILEAVAKRTGLNLKVKEIDDALQRLVTLRSILKHTSKGYEFAVEAFPFVIANTVTLNDMLHVISEDYKEQCL